MLDLMPKGGRLLRWGLPIGLVVVIGIVAGVLVGRKAPPPVASAPPSASMGASASASASGPVDSFATGAYSLAAWSINETHTAGWIDTVSVEPGGGHEVASDDQVLVVTGWAGEPIVGIRLPTVVLTLCDTVVGVAPVNGSRPDVAANVHPNLGFSGWRARLLVGHLVRCEGTSLEAWAVYPDSAVLLPLDGRIRITLPPRNPAVSLAAFSSRAPLIPDPTLRSKSITISADSPLVFKRKPGADGAVLNQFSPGRYTAYRLDERDNWLLLAIEGKAGWVAREAIKVLN